MVKGITPAKVRAKAKAEASRKAKEAAARARLLSSQKQAAIRQYELAVKQVYSQDFEKAKASLEKLMQTYPDDKEILERATSLLKLCEQRMAPRPPAPRSTEDHYNLAVALMNQGQYQESLEHLHKALKSNPNCEYVIYALAAASCRTGDYDGALNQLKTAIRLKPENRFLAQQDSDFEPLLHDSRFISMVFPDRVQSPQPQGTRSEAD
ncbi:MAG: tetratricopeptide repeat protein [Acidobacteriota bacterium]